MFDLVYEKTSEGWLVTGQTYHLKELIKSLGGRWQKEKNAWLLVDINELKECVSMQKALNLFQLERFKNERLNRHV